MNDTGPHSDYLDARETLADLIHDSHRRVCWLDKRCPEAGYLADAIIDAGWKSPQQIEQTKAEVCEQGGAVGENYGFQSHSSIRPARPKNPYRKDTK